MKIYARFGQVSNYQSVPKMKSIVFISNVVGFIYFWASFSCIYILNSSKIGPNTLLTRIKIVTKNQTFHYIVLYLLI